MCGRFVSVATPEDLVARFDIDEVATEPLRPSWNVAPSSDIYSILDTDGSRRLGSLRWGYIPRWGPSRVRAPINARVETVATSRMFADSFEHRRCLIPADGFYEWRQREDERPKQPYWIQAPDDAPLAFAGIWSTWRPDDGEPTSTCAIVTTAATGEMQHIHDRMPLILPPRLWDAWNQVDEDAEHLLAAVQAMAPPALRAVPIGTQVNSVRNNGPELLEPVRD